MIEKIRELVKKESESNDWQFHIQPVVRYALDLAKIYKADLELVELAALLHDIGRIRSDDESHEISGQTEAEKILKEFNYPQETIDEIKHCIASHRGSRDVAPQTITAKIIANADAMAHFDIAPLFFYWRADRYSFSDIVKWVEEKMERNWDKKLTLLEAKEIIRPKYDAIKLILDSVKQYI